MNKTTTKFGKNLKTLKIHKSGIRLPILVKSNSMWPWGLQTNTSFISSFQNFSFVSGDDVWVVTKKWHFFKFWNFYELNLSTELLNKQKLLSSSANALKLCLTSLPPNTSFDTIHNLTKRATPPQMSIYKHALQLYKLYNSNIMTEDWISLNHQQIFNGRNEKFQVFNISTYKVGRNLLVNRFKSLNNKINFSWFNDSYNTFKVKCK